MDKIFFTRAARALSRRDFLSLISGLCGSVILCSACRRQESGEPLVRLVNLGPPSQYPLGITPRPAERVTIVRDSVGIAVMSAVCTHQVCVLRVGEQPGAPFECPCHGSLFALDGAVQRGPAIDPLPFYEIVQNERGELIVDLNQTVSPNSRLIVRA